jgi:4-amino-4-deoxy-L-arabinose transferase-like glycosyltransferase
VGEDSEPIGQPAPEALDRSPLDSGSAGPAAGRRGSGLWRRLDDLSEVVAGNLTDPARIVGVLFVAAFFLRLLWLNLPGHSLIFDEAYYVNAARVILGWPATTHYADAVAGLDPNTEHPPLGKLVIAGSMLLFGDNGLGWRLPSVIASMVALFAVYNIVRILHRSAWLAVLVVALVSFDNLTFVHGRIGTLDMLVLAPMLVGAWLALRRQWLLAGVAMGIALLVKLTAIYGIGAVLLYVLLTEGPRWWRARRLPFRSLGGPALFTVVTLAVAFGGLALLDARFSSYSSPLDHLARMISYGANLAAPIGTGFCPAADSRPWQWLFNECQIQYLRLDVTVRAGDQVISKVPTIDFRGAMNPLLVGAIPLATLFAAWYAWRKRNRLALWAIAWGAANYLPYVALALLTSRIMYIYYALPLVPAISIAIALLLLRARLPRPILWGYLAAYLAGFLAYFPFRQIP